ncbi:MAG: hypothetical protein V3T18_01085, partial [Pseudomonadales bacterium]
GEEIPTSGVFGLTSGVSRLTSGDRSVLQYDYGKPTARLPDSRFSANPFTAPGIQRRSLKFLNGETPYGGEPLAAQI